MIKKEGEDEEVDARMKGTKTRELDGQELS